jgi:hypothetical protein
VQHERVAVGVAEERHVTDPGVERVALELDTFRFEIGSRLRDVLHLEREVRRLLRLELLAEPLRLPDVQALIAGPELEPSVVVAAQAERVDVERGRPARRRADGIATKSILA